MEMPLDMPNMPDQRFEKPDPKKLVAKEQIKTPGGTFTAGHYRDKASEGTVDVWVHESVPPLGLIKVVLTPNPGAGGPAGPTPTTIELIGKGKGAKSSITKEPKPFNPAMLGIPGGGPGHPPPDPPPPAKKK